MFSLKSFVNWFFDVVLPIQRWAQSKSEDLNMHIPTLSNNPGDWPAQLDDIEAQIAAPKHRFFSRLADKLREQGLTGGVSIRREGNWAVVEFHRGEHVIELGRVDVDDSNFSEYWDLSVETRPNEDSSTEAPV